MDLSQKQLGTILRGYNLLHDLTVDDSASAFRAKWTCPSATWSMRDFDSTSRNVSELQPLKSSRHETYSIARRTFPPSHDIMEPRTTRLGTDIRTRRAHTKLEKEVEQYPSNGACPIVLSGIFITDCGVCKKRRQAESGERSEPPRKSPRLCTGGKVQPQPSRENLRLWENRDLHQGQVERANRQQVEKSRLDFNSPLLPEDWGQLIKDEKESKLSTTRPEAQSNLKQSRNIEGGDLSNDDVQHSKRNEAAESNPKVDHNKDGFVKAWLCSIDREKSFEGLDLVAADIALPPPNGGRSFICTSSSKSDKSSVRPYDPGFKAGLGYRNIYIHSEDPPIRLMKRAKEIIMGSRLSPELEETAAQELTRKSRNLWDDAEDAIIRQLAVRVISAMAEVTDRRLSSTAGLQWTNCVPVPLDPSVTTNTLPLSRPKPDAAFGYSEKAFTKIQLDTIRLLKNQLRWSYAMPYQELYFPFMAIELKSQAKGGTQNIATKQAASAGAVIGHGLVELARRGLGLDSLDYDEPQFFSITMDHELVKINVHWLAVSEETGQFCFHVEGLSKHVLDDMESLRAIQRAVKNILDWGGNNRLPTICKQLDRYREKDQTRNSAEKKVPAAASENILIESELQNDQKQTGRKRKSNAITNTALNIEGPEPAPPLPEPY